MSLFRRCNWWEPKHPTSLVKIVRIIVRIHVNRSSCVPNRFLKQVSLHSESCHRKPRSLVFLPRLETERNMATAASKGISGPPAVIDNGTGYTKMGFAGNVEPQYIIPTVTASKTDVDSMKGKRDGIEDLDFFIGDKALNNNNTHQINYPIRGVLSTIGTTWSVCGRAACSSISVVSQRSITCY